MCSMNNVLWQLSLLWKGAVIAWSILLLLFTAVWNIINQDGCSLSLALNILQVQGGLPIKNTRWIPSSVLVMEERPMARNGATEHPKVEKFSRVNVRDRRFEVHRCDVEVSCSYNFSLCKRINVL